MLVFLADDVGWEAFSTYGGTSYSTPHIDRLAAEGIRFDNGYATPLCTPTRALLMTGRYNFRNYERFAYLDPSEPTFANALRGAGYATTIVGKWQLGGDEDTPAAFGFDDFLLWQLTQRNNWTRYRNPVLHRKGGEVETLEGRYGPDVFADYIEAFMEDHRDRPFLVYYPMVLVHSPFQPPPNHPDYLETPIVEFSDPSYFGAMMSYMDAIVGRLVAKLEELGIRENTLILFIGDNGTHPEIVSRIKGSEVRGAKGRTTEAGTRVPFIASWPAVISPGQARQDLVDVADVLPTLLDVAGVHEYAGPRPDGFSLYPTFRTGAPHSREWIFRDYHPRGPRHPARTYVQDGRYKLYHGGAFYDFVSDPLERSPLDPRALTPAQRRAKRKLEAVMRRMQEEMRDS